MTEPSQSRSERAFKSRKPWPIPRPHDAMVQVAKAFIETGHGDPYRVAGDLAKEIIRIDLVIRMREDGL